jgi:hypothetical protein
MDQMVLPAALTSGPESHPLLARLKKRATKQFRWTSAHALRDVVEFAYWCQVFGRDQEALDICAFLGQYHFAGNYRLWTQIEFALALQARLLRQQRQKPKAAACIRRIQDAGFVESRLNGEALDPNSALKIALREGDLVRERSARLSRLKELCFIRELGGSATLPVSEVERDYQQNLARLRILAGEGRTS